MLSMARIFRSMGAMSASRSCARVLAQTAKSKGRVVSIFITNLVFIVSFSTLLRQVQCIESVHVEVAHVEEFLGLEETFQLDGCRRG